MSAIQEAMRTSIASANSGKQATVAAAVTTYLTSIETGTSVASANAALVAARALAEMTKQASIAVARDLLRSQGEIPF